MNVPSAEERQVLIRRVLESLAAAQAPTLQVRLPARIAEGAGGIRGILNPSPRPAVPLPFRENASPSLESLRVGHELHVVVSSPRRGYLHLFNLGSSGAVLRMLPRQGSTPVTLEPDRAYLASPAPSEPWVEKGPANGFPERVLAIVTAEPRQLLASSLDPSFSDAAYTRGFSPPIVEALLSAWPATDWAWGCCEARVEN